MTKQTWIVLVTLATLLGIQVSAQTPEALIAEGEALYAQRQDPLLAARSLAKYQEALRLAPDHYQALWKNAQVMYYIGDHSSDSKEKLKIFKEAMALCKKAVAVRPRRRRRPLLAGRAYRQLRRDPGRAQVTFPEKRHHHGNEKSHRPRRHVRKRRRLLRPRAALFQSARPFRRQQQKVAPEPGKMPGDRPKNSVNLLFLAETYWDMGEKQLAIRTLEELMSMEPDPDWIPETEKDKKRARNCCKSTKNKAAPLQKIRF